MSEVVTSCRRDRRDHVKIIYFGDLFEPPTLQHHVHHLRDVQPVQVVVVRHILPIALVDAAQEAHQLLVIESGGGAVVQGRQIHYHLVSNSYKSVLSSQNLIDFEAVKVD